MNHGRAVFFAEVVCPLISMWRLHNDNRIASMRSKFQLMGHFEPVEQVQSEQVKQVQSEQVPWGWGSLVEQELQVQVQVPRV
jgi:hypothetical protein